MEIIALHNDIHADYNVFKTTEELLESLSGDVEEMIVKKKEIEDKLSKYPDYNVYRWTQQSPRRGIRYHDADGTVNGLLDTLYFCRSADDDYTGSDGDHSYTWSAYFLFKDTGQYDSDHKKIYKTTDEKNIVIYFTGGSPSSWSHVDAYKPTF